MAKAPTKTNSPAATTGTGTDLMSNRPNYLQKETFNLPVDEQVRFPRLLLIQALSPEATKGNEKYIPKLEVGTLLLKSDTMVREIDGEKGIVVIPLAIRKRYVEYVPRDAGGGFVASYETKEEMENNKDPENDIQVTIEYLCIEAGVDDPTPFTITFDTISKLGTAQKWAGYIKQYETMEGVKYCITGKQALNKRKQAYYVYNVQPIGWADKNQLALAQNISGNVSQLFLPSETNKEI